MKSSTIYFFQTINISFSIEILWHTKFIHSMKRLGENGNESCIRIGKKHVCCEFKRFDHHNTITRQPTVRYDDRLFQIYKILFTVHFLCLMFIPLLCEPIWKLIWKLVKFASMFILVCELNRIRNNLIRRRSTLCSSQTKEHIQSLYSARLRTVK